MATFRLRRAAVVLLAVLGILLATAPVSQGSTTSAAGDRLSTEAQMRTLAKQIDPAGTMNWVWKRLDNAAGLAEPWKKTLTISSGYAYHYLKPIMLHEWSHALEYKAYGSTVAGWYNAENALDALLGKTVAQAQYEGLEKGADCIAKALGADYLSYGCPAALRTFGARIAGGLKLTAPLGRPQSFKVSGTALTVSGWSLDPTYPTRSNSVQVTDNGIASSARVTTNSRRTDVDSYYGVTGNHGYAVTVRLKPGTHRICVVAASIGGVTATPTNCQQVVIGGRTAPVLVGAYDRILTRTSARRLI